jgi:ubiquinone/menaquinone biosynthesis C-methylase UbiE
MTDYLQQEIGKLRPRYAEVYDECSLWGARFGTLLLQHLEIRPDITGLDVGCATGFPLFELAQVHGPSSRFIGIDVWSEALDRARMKIEVYGLTNVEVREADASSLPFDDATFDLIASNLGINNFADPPVVMRECYRVARPGARVALTTNLTGHMADFYYFFRRTLEELGHADRIEAVNEQERHRGTRRTIEALVTDAGFGIGKVVESEFVLRYANGSAMLRHPLVKFFLDGWRTAIAGADEVTIFGALESRLNRMGELHMRVPMLYVEGVKLPKHV